MSASTFESTCASERGLGDCAHVKDVVLAQASMACCADLVCMSHTLLVLVLYACAYTIACMFCCVCVVLVGWSVTCCQESLSRCIAEEYLVPRRPVRHRGCSFRCEMRCSSDMIVWVWNMTFEHELMIFMPFPTRVGGHHLH